MKHQRTLSIIIPTWNEEGNVTALIEEISSTLINSSITYELIVVDDNSTDTTVKTLKKLAKKYPLRIFMKKGKKGKATSLLEGFSYARYKTVCMIDADLQYPPSAIAIMYEKLQSGADIVITEREHQNVSLKRKVTSKGFHLFFSRLLHGLNFDTQSGLKMFRREILKNIELNPTEWGFDMEFLLKAKKAGYTIDSVPITLQPRLSGEAKINVFRASFQLAVSSLLLKFAVDTPQPLPAKKTGGTPFTFNGMEFNNYSNLPYTESALYTLTPAQKATLFFLGVAVVLGLLLEWHITLVLFIAAITFFYFIDLFFNFFLIYRSFSHAPEVIVTEKEIGKVRASEWPLYTIYCPLYKEWEVVPQFISAIEKLDYPKNKLQVLLLLEEDDKETIDKVRQFSLPSYMEVAVVPDAKPKTKPKALNYGLTKTRGEYVVVYDAEDVPDPLQLKKAVLAFEKTDDKTICIQAKLNFYNPNQNLLTRVFTAEYSLWFDLVLTGLQSIKAPIPLGGTSNHFKTKDIRLIHGWDAFNVTEDCDLGTRLTKHGYQTAIVDSTTYEEANSSTWNWFNQRSRWIKGYIQTYFVHMRHPGEFFQNGNKTHALYFQLIVGTKILSLFINPFLWLSTVLYFLLRPYIGETIESFYPTPVLYMGVFSLVVGNFLYIYYYMVGCAKRGYDEVIPYALFVPVYWLMMSIASWKALYEFIRKPHYWAKTRHGLHLSKNPNEAPHESKIAAYPVEVSPALTNKGW